MADKIINFGGSVKYYKDYNQLSDSQLVSLCKKSQKTLESAYALYSNFKVGSALLLENGSIIVGSNQENAVYPLGLCAERVALFSASSQYPNVRITALAVATAKTLAEDELPAFPCGSCRQVIHEVEQRQESEIPLLIVGNDNSLSLVDGVSDILPFAFGKNSL